MTSSDSSCRANSNSVTTPKLPPPPRSAQNRSAYWSADVRRILPSAVTTSADSRLSTVRPKRRISRPTPPPRVRPPTPVWLTTPAGTTRPCRWVARSTSPSSAPPPTMARCVTGSTATRLSSRRSITMPPSQVLCPGIECPPPRTAIGRPPARAKPMAAATSGADRGRAISAGPAVVHSIPDGAGRVVARLVRADHRAAEAGDHVRQPSRSAHSRACMPAMTSLCWWSSTGCGNSGPPSCQATSIGPVRAVLISRQPSRASPRSPAPRRALPRRRG